jgi:group I intron endonuclease
MHSGIYEIVNSESGKRYVGSSISFDRRWRDHTRSLAAGKHHSRYLQAPWDKYGSAAFVFRRLVVCEPVNLLLYEQIAMDALKPEYNSAPRAGNTLGVKLSAEARARISAAKLGNASTKGRPRDPEAVAKTAAAHRGMKRSDETRAKIAAKALGRKYSAETVEKRAAKLRGVALPPERVAHLIGNKFAAGVVYSDERRAAISEFMTGQPRPKSPEHRAKIAAALRGRKATPEARANQSAAQRGKPRGPRRKPDSAPPETQN